MELWNSLEMCMISVSALDAHTNRKSKQRQTKRSSTASPQVPRMLNNIEDSREEPNGEHGKKKKQLWSEDPSCGCQR